jgi:hypothetical protein
MQPENNDIPAENMEVHHHPVVEKKRFKEYLLEGLMIFLAVTMGFFAESLRENINNREKEKEYINSLTGNLVQDTIHLYYTIKENKNKIEYLDSLISLASKNMEDPVNRQLLYRFSGSISFYSRFSSIDATMMQLKNSGGLQYIRHNHIADSIAKYDQEVRTIYAAEQPYGKAINDAIDAMAGLLLFKLSNDSSYFRDSGYSTKKFPLLTNDSQKLEIFFNKIFLERGWTQNYVNNLQDRLPYLKRLIALLKKEYAVD